MGARRHGRLEGAQAGRPGGSGWGTGPQRRHRSVRGRDPLTRAETGLPHTRYVVRSMSGGSTAAGKQAPLRPFKPGTRHCRSQSRSSQMRPSSGRKRLSPGRGDAELVGIALHAVDAGGLLTGGRCMRHSDGRGSRGSCQRSDRRVRGGHCRRGRLRSSRSSGVRTLRPLGTERQIEAPKPLQAITFASRSESGPKRLRVVPKVSPPVDGVDVDRPAHLHRTGGSDGAPHGAVGTRGGGRIGMRAFAM